MSAFNTDILTEIVEVGIALQTVYTNPAETKTSVKTIIVHNKGGAPTDLEIYKAPNTEGVVTVATLAHRWKKITALAADGDAVIELRGPGLILNEENDTIQIIASIASNLTYQMYGILET
jgi:hypothetical protein